MHLTFKETKEEVYAAQRVSKHVSPHLHNALEIVCVTEGTLEMGVGQELYHMEKGDVGFAFSDIIHYYQVFSKTFHRNFNQYLNDARLSYACTRLVNSGDTILDICLDSGFDSQRTFNRAFKERYRITPSEYRKLKR